MPNKLPPNLVVNFLVFQAPYIFAKLSGISVSFISEGTCMVSVTGFKLFNLEFRAAINEDWN